MAFIRHFFHIRLKSLRWITCVGAISAGYPALALPPCAAIGDPPKVFVRHLDKDSINIVDGLLAVSGGATAKEDVSRVDLFIDGVAVDVRKKGVDLTLLNAPSADIVEFEFKVDVAMNPLPARLTMRPGRHKIHVFTTTVSGQCVKIERDVEGRQPRVYAVIVGINAPNSQLRPLKFAYSDALAFRDYLEKDLGVPPDHISLLPDKPDSPVPVDVTSISEELERFKGLNVEADTVLFFFAGHGVLIGGEQYLVPMRGNIDLPKSTLLKLDTVRDYLKDSRARRRVFFVDACNVADSAGQRGATPPTEGRRGNEDLTKLWSNWSGSFGIAASKPSEPSWEHPSISAGVFTHFLLEAFRNAKVDDKHTVTLKAAYDYVEENVPKFATGSLSPPITPQHPTLIDNTDEAGKIAVGYH